MSDWQVDFIKQDALPKLAWLAEVATDAGVVVVHHGGAVETRPHWFVEGTWDGRFEAGDFHRSENLFGSGMRVDGSTLTFCASVALVDRLFHVAWNDRLLVSNSLIQLLARTGARLDPRHNYRKESFASGSGSSSTLAPSRSFTRRSARSSRTITATWSWRRAGSSGNCVRDPGGSHPSRSITTLCRARWRESATTTGVPPGGTGSRHLRPLRPAMTRSRRPSLHGRRVSRRPLPSRSPKARTRYEHDSGVRIAQTLGLTTHGLPSARLGRPDLERYLLAATVEGSEVFLENVAHFIGSNCSAATLYTGYHGDVVWKRPAGPPESSDDMQRKDVSGLNLSEIRLAAGFFNLAVPFIYGRNMADITAISNSSAMASWSLPQDYDRPIPRRIVESAGVPRDLFGQRKRAQVRFYGDPRDPALRAEFRAYLRSLAGTLQARLRLIELLHSADHGLMMLMRRVLGLKRNAEPAAVDRHRSLRSAQPGLRLGSRQPRVPLRVGLCRESAATPRARRRARPHRDSAARALAISPRIR